MNARRPPLQTYGIAINQERKRVHRVPEHTHAGLWYDKYLDQQYEQSSQGFTEYASGMTPYQEHIRTVSKLEAPPVYATYLKRWKESLEKQGTFLFEGRTLGRQVVGLGGSGVIENGISLHHTYGVPYLPGSALKGLAAHYARNYLDDNWGKKSEAYQLLFGTQKQQGLVTFFDALPETYSFRPDILTVHHKEYYQSGTVPADWDNPVPIPFLTVVSGRFQIPLAGPEAWVQTAVSILHGALNDLGIGAKTSSGYGRMRIYGVDKPQLPQPPEPIELTVGIIFTATVSRIGDENIEMHLDPSNFTNVTTGADQLVYLEKQPDLLAKLGNELTCIAIDCDIDDSTVFIQCEIAE